MIPASCSYHPAGTKLKLFLPCFDHFPIFFSSNDTFLALTFEVLLLRASSKTADPSGGSIFVQGATEHTAEGAQKLEAHPNWQANNSSLLSCLWCLSTGSCLQACAKQRDGPQIIPGHFRVKCSA